MAGQDPWSSRPRSPSVYRTAYEVSTPDGTSLSLSLDGLHDRVLGESARWKTANLFYHEDPAVRARLADLRAATLTQDSTYALGAVLLACAYRRKLLQEEHA